MSTKNKGYTKLEDTKVDRMRNPEQVLSFWITHLTPALIEKARTELGETDEIREKCLSEFKKLIASEKNLVAFEDDTLLLAFLRGRKFNVKKAFKVFQKFWLFRKEYNHIYDNFDPDLVKELILRNFLGFLNFRDKNGSAVFIFKVCKWNTEIDSFENTFRAITAFLVYSLDFPATHVAGFRVIFDLRNLSWNQMKYITPSNIILMVRSTQFCFPGRFKGVHVITNSKLFKLFTALVYPLLTAKLKKRIFFHDEDVKPLTEFVHPSVLPEEFGGEAPTFDNSSWEKIAEEQTDRFMEMRHFGYKN